MTDVQTEQPAGPDGTIRDEEVEALRAAFGGRCVALAGVAVLTTILSPWPAPVYYWALLLLFVANGYLAWRVARAAWGRPWHQYAIVFVDFALLAFTLIYPNPFAPFDLPPQVNLRFGNFVYFFILLSSLAYVYKPRLVLWGGVCGAVCWTAGVAWLMNRPGARWRSPVDGNVETFLGLLGDPTFIDLGVRLQEVVVFLLAAILIALGAARMRALALRQAEVARQRTNLARYFPDQTADYLAAKSDPFTIPREVEAAVLFADIVGFTAWSERSPPTDMTDFLREAHGRLAEIVFKWNGTLDKFIGDGLMATFGTPSPSGRDAANALQAAIEMAEAYDAWRATLTPDRGGDLRLSIGLQFGTVVVGDIGSRDRLEFATLGDTVNVASRLEAATREVGCRVLIGEAVLTRAREETGSEQDRLIAMLDILNPVRIRGRSASVPARCYR